MIKKEIQSNNDNNDIKLQTNSDEWYMILMIIMNI